MPNQPATPLRTYRAPDDEYDPALALSQERGEPLSEVIRRALRRYVRSYGHDDFVELETALTLDRDLLRAVEAKAAERGVTLSHIIEELLREYMRR